MLPSKAILQVMTCLSVLALAAPLAHAADNQHSPTQAADHGTRGNSADRGPYDKYNDPSCTPNLPNCYTFEPSGNLSKQNPIKPKSNQNSSKSK